MNKLVILYIKKKKKTRKLINADKLVLHITCTQDTLRILTFLTRYSYYILSSCITGKFEMLLRGIFLKVYQIRKNIQSPHPIQNTIKTYILRKNLGEPLFIWFQCVWISGMIKVLIFVFVSGAITLMIDGIIAMNEVHPVMQNTTGEALYSLLTNFIPPLLPCFEFPLPPRFKFSQGNRQQKKNIFFFFLFYQGAGIAVNEIVKETEIVPGQGTVNMKENVPGSTDIESGKIGIDHAGLSLFPHPPRPIKNFINRYFLTFLSGLILSFFAGNIGMKKNPVNITVQSTRKPKNPNVKRKKMVMKHLVLVGALQPQRKLRRRGIKKKKKKRLSSHTLF